MRSEIEIRWGDHNNLSPTDLYLDGRPGGGKNEKERYTYRRTLCLARLGGKEAAAAGSRGLAAPKAARARLTMPAAGTCVPI